MKVSVINIQKVEKEGIKLVGVASIVINDKLYVNDVKIVKVQDKLFIAMPSKKVNETFKDIAHPTNNECKNKIEEVVLKAYNGENYEEGVLEELKVTDIHIKPIANSDKLVAVASVVFNNQFVVNDVVLIKRDETYNISFPTRKAPDGTFKNICLLKDNELMYSIEESIVNAYKTM